MCRVPIEYTCVCVCACVRACLCVFLIVCIESQLNMWGSIECVEFQLNTIESQLSAAGSRLNIYSIESPN